MLRGAQTTLGPGAARILAFAAIELDQEIRNQRSRLWAGEPKTSHISRWAAPLLRNGPRPASRDGKWLNENLTNHIDRLPPRGACAGRDCDSGNAVRGACQAPISVTVRGKWPVPVDGFWRSNTHEPTSRNTPFGTEATRSPGFWRGRACHKAA